MSVGKIRLSLRQYPRNSRITFQDLWIWFALLFYALHPPCLTRECLHHICI